jgi:hypothetical protein
MATLHVTIIGWHTRVTPCVWANCGRLTTQRYTHTRNVPAPGRVSRLKKAVKQAGRVQLL